MSEPMVTHFADEYTLARLARLEAENATLRERIEQLEYMEAWSAAEAKAERGRLARADAVSLKESIERVRKLVSGTEFAKSEDPVGDRHEIRHVSPRLETGVIEVEGDWPGVFFRGDDAASFAISLRLLLEGGKSPRHRHVVQELLSEMERSNVQSDAHRSAKIQRIRGDWEACA